MIKFSCGNFRIKVISNFCVSFGKELKHISCNLVRDEFVLVLSLITTTEWTEMRLYLILCQNVADWLKGILRDEDVIKLCRMPWKMYKRFNLGASEKWYDHQIKKMIELEIA